MRKILKSFSVLAVIFLFVLSKQLQAKTYRYVDHNGQVWYVDSVNKIPAKYRSAPKTQAGSVSRQLPRTSSPSIPSRDRSGVPPETVFPDSSRLDKLVNAVTDVMADKEGFIEKNFMGINIAGEPYFVDRIIKALELLMSEAPFEFKNIRNQISLIRQGERTMMWTQLKPPVMTINAGTATHTTTFNAGIIAHESCHMRLFNEGKSANPGDYNEIQQEEMTCIKYEEQVMIKIGAPPQELKMLRKQDGAHFDVNKDGKYDLNDFEQMDW